MMRRRGNQSNARGGTAGCRNPRIDFVCRQMTTLSRFGTLGHLDLNLLCAVQILQCYTESSGSDLFHCRIPYCSETGRIFSPFTRIGTCPETVHRFCHRLMCLFGNRAEGHGACIEALYDFLSRLHFFKRYRCFRCFKGTRITQTVRLHVVQQSGIMFEVLVLSASAGCLQSHNHFR